MRILIPTLLLALATPAIAAKDTAPPPPLPTEGDSLQTEPQVTIIQRNDEVVEEYRVGGRLRYAKITPKHGRPYYMYDSDGDGILDTRSNDLKNPPINRWILKTW